MNQTEQNIINKICTGDEEQITIIYSLYRDEFINWSRLNYNATEDQSKDAFQEAILDFYHNIVSGKLTELSSTIKTYLFQIGTHKLLNIQKKERRMTYHGAFHLINSGESEKFMEEESKNYTQEQIGQAIEKLPEDCQKVLKLFYFKEYDMDSIAREMDYKNADTAKSKKSVCMKNLYKELKKLSMMLII